MASDAGPPQAGRWRRRRKAGCRMRIIEDRYFRDLRPLLLADWMLQLEARTRTICTWTGLSRDRVRRLAVSTGQSPGQEVGVRHRGRSPRQTTYFFRSPHLWAHASALASYFVMGGLLPRSRTVIPKKSFPSVRRGEQLCQTYEIYRIAYSSVPIDFERGILLATALARHDELDLGRCRECGGLILVDLLAQHNDAPRLCQMCRMPGAAAGTALDLQESGGSKPEQMQLFGVEETRLGRLNGSTPVAGLSRSPGRNVASPTVIAGVDSEDSISMRGMREPDDPE